jgi:predicted DNA-binding ArsR family transcriptional regulator
MEKIRNTPHVEGNFSTYFYIKLKSSKKVKNLEEDIQKLITDDNFNFSQIDDYHISLSKTFFLKYHQINNFIKDIRVRLTKVKQHILLTPRIKYLSNEFNNRHFLSLELFKSKNLMLLIKELNEIIKIYNAQYEFDISSYLPHLSLFWSDKTFNLSKLNEDDLNIEINKKWPQNVALKTIEIENSYFKIGSRIYKIWQ